MKNKKSSHNRAITVGDGGYESDAFRRGIGEMKTKGQKRWAPAHKKRAKKTLEKKAAALPADQLAAAISRCEGIIANEAIPARVRRAARQKLATLTAAR